MVVCIAEDRLGEQIGVKLLVASLSRHCPGFPIEVFHPPADDKMQRWIARFPHATLRTTPPVSARGWNIKPFALKAMLAAGHDEVWWIDSDVLVYSDFRNLFADLQPQDLVAAEEAIAGKYRDDGYRARAWGLELGRALPFSLNTGVVRFTQAHRDLLDAWCEAVDSPLYLQAQSLKVHERPFHLIGDQDVLTALLCEKHFANIPLKILERGRHIIQDLGAAGYTPAERARNLFRPPALLHTPRDKPWHRSDTAPPLLPLRNYIGYVRLESSPYCLAAADYIDDVDDPIWWVRSRSAGGRLMRVLGAGQPALTGLPLALLYQVEKMLVPHHRIDDQFDPGKALNELEPKWLKRPVTG